MAMDFIAEIPGAAELRDQFGGFPSFADARAELQINGNGTGFLKISSYFLDAARKYDPTRPFVATIQFDGLVEASLSEFCDQLYLDELKIKKIGDVYQVGWEAAYGVHGDIQSRALRIIVETGGTTVSPKS